MKKLSVIYDVTALCPWNCSICCMGATDDKTCKNSELTTKQQMNIVSQLAQLRENGYDVKIDLSGGEIFTDKEKHIPFIKVLSDTLGKEKVGISCSGYGINRELAGFLGKYVHDVEMTMDVVPYRPYKLRPIGYSVSAAKAVSLLKKAGCEVGIQTVVSNYNRSYADALSVFAWCCANNVDNWSLLRFFPSGRGAEFPEAYMNDEECRKYVHMVQEIVRNCPSEHKPEVDFHYSMPGHKKYTDICRCVRHSIGILPNGDVVACFWALDSSTGIVAPKFLLGNMKENSLIEILSGEKARYWSECPHTCEFSAA